MKIRKIVAFVLAACLLVVNVPVTAFADVLESEESIENSVDHASPSEGENITEEASFSDAEYIEEETAEEILDESDASTGELSDTIVLTAETSDGITVTMKADMSAFASSKHASPSEAEKDEFASPSDTIESDKFDSELLTLVADVVEEKDEETVDEALEDETKDDNIASRKTYDIYVLYDGEKTEPAEGKKVEVSFAITNAPSGADEVTVYHHTEDGIETIVDEKLDEATASQAVYEVGEQTEDKTEEKKETVSTEEIKDIDETDESLDGDVYDDVSMITVTGETDSFSLYTIDFTYNEKTVSIPGDTTGNLLADVLKDVGIEGQILEAKAYQDKECRIPAENGIVKNETGAALFKIYEKNDVWYADAINAFNTEHGLYVKTEDAEYEIKVTDGGGVVCKIGDKEYDTIANALAAEHTGESSSNPTKIVLINNDTENVSIPGDNKETTGVDETRFITFDLNGYVLQGTGSGSVITNKGTLTIKDSNNTKTHYFKYSKSSAWTLYDDADENAKNSAIEVDAITGTTADDTLIKVYGGCITGGNSGSEHGGGVIASAYSEFTMTGGNICGNNANQGGGLYTGSNTIVEIKDITIAGNHAAGNCGGMIFNADKNGNSPDPGLTIGGTVKITENTSPDGKDNNLTLWTDETPLVISSSIEGSKIGVNIRKSDTETIAGAFTKNGTENDVQYFTSDNAAYTVVYKEGMDKTGHLELVSHVHGAWKYTASKSKLTATCGNPGCTATAFAVSITINANDKLYDGNKYSNASIDNIDKWIEAGLGTLDIDYYVKGQSTKLDEAPTAAGEYTAKIAAGDKTAVADFTISQKSLTVKGTTADGKTYDGTTTVVAHIGTTSEIVDADKGSVTVSIKTAEFDDKDVGNSKSVTVSYNLTGTKAGNYTVADSTTSADIKKRAITITSGSATKAYDGKPLTKDEVKDSLTESADKAGFVDGEGATYTVTGSQTDVGASANTFTYTLNEGTKADNYTITKEEGVLKVLEAEKCIITFEMNGHGTQVSEQYVVLNQKISRPEDPTADHWCFKGWYLQGMETAWDFLSDTVSEDITLYAKWTEGDHTVRFNYDGISDLCVQHNEIITLPGAQKSSYEFLGWLENGEKAGELHLADSDYQVTEDVSFTPSFAEKKVIAGKEIKISDTSDIDASKAGKGSNETEKLIIRQVSEAKLASAYPVDISSSIRESTLETYLQAAPSANELIFKLNVKLTDVHSDSKETSTTTKLTYNVTPVFYAMKDGAAVSSEQVVSNSEIREPVKFCLTVPTSALAVAEVKHMSSDGKTVKDTKYYDVQTITNEDGVTEKYIEAYSSNFSDFVITFTDTRPTNSKAQSSGSSSAISALWIKDAKGWRYRFAGGGYATNGWYELDNPYASGTQEKRSWFHFGADNYMHIGWFTDKDGRKYYLHTVEDGTLGRMYHGKQTIDGKVYEFSEVHDGYFGHLIETGTKKK